MRNPLRRLVNRDRPPPRAPIGAGMAMAMPRTAAPDDHYLVESDQAIEQPSAVDRIIHALQLVLIIVLAVLSLAVFWLLGLLFNIL
jgi:hypothetical protein